MRISDWSSDVCSSDLQAGVAVIKKSIIRSGGACRSPFFPSREERSFDKIRTNGVSVTSSIVPDSEARGLVARLPDLPRALALLARFDRPIGWWLLFWPGDRKSTRLNSSH